MTPETEQKEVNNINVTFFSPELEFSSSESSGSTSPVNTKHQQRNNSGDYGYVRYPYLKSTRVAPLTPFLAKPPTELFTHRVKKSNVINYIYYILILFCILMFLIFIITQQFTWFPYSFLIFIAVCIVRYYRNKK